MKIDPEQLQAKMDMESKYVDFHVLRTALSVYTLLETDESLSKPNEDGECRGRCPKCNKDRSFALNINKNRFNCFNKGCDLKGGGVIDFASKLYDLPAKEAAHLLACAYGIQPYTAEDSGESDQDENGSRNESREVSDQKPDHALNSKNGEHITRAEFDEVKGKYTDLQKRFERLSNVVFGYMLEHDEMCHQEEEFDEQIEEHLIAH